MGTQGLHALTGRRSRRPAALLLGLLVCVTPLCAQDTEDFEVWSPLSEIMGLITDMEFLPDDDEKSWLVKLGVVGGVAPEYRGADEYEFSYAPDIEIVWRDLLFLKGRKLGVRLARGKHVYGGAFVRYTGGRSEDNEGLDGLGDISRTWTTGLYLNFRYKALRLKTEVRHDFFDEGHGTLAIASLGSRIPWDEPVFFLALETTWASEEYMDSFFSITQFQSLQSGLSVFDADAGFRDVSLSLSSGYELGEHWSITGQVRYQYLLGDAADSPVVRERGSEHDFVVGVGLNYAF